MEKNLRATLAQITTELSDVKRKNAELNVYREAFADLKRENEELKAYREEFADLKRENAKLNEDLIHMREKRDKYRDALDERREETMVSQIAFEALRVSTGASSQLREEQLTTNAAVRHVRHELRSHREYK
jgi:uncharacterized coiled-coil DUF342 family protein